ncbi:MAG: recombination protein RecR [Phycisphaera sp.]|nr:recombination protein RecR [Phycisphaera sp.]
MNRLIDRFARLPGIGRRTAERLAFHILKATPDEALALSRAISDVKTNVRHCPQCYNLTESETCPICSDTRRDPRVILVVEQPKDVIVLEQAGNYRGVYHVLLGHISPLEGVTATDLTIDALVDRATELAQGGAVEVILGTNPNMEGDGTALTIAERLNGIANVTITRLARGLPAGTQLEYANKAVLSDAIASRQSMG